MPLLFENNAIYEPPFAYISSTRKATPFSQIKKYFYENYKSIFYAFPFDVFWLSKSVFTEGAFEKYLDVFKNSNKEFENLNKEFESLNKEFENKNKEFGNTNKEFESLNKEFENKNKEFGNTNKEFENANK